MVGYRRISAENPAVPERVARLSRRSETKADTARTGPDVPHASAFCFLLSYIGGGMPILFGLIKANRG